MVWDAAAQKYMTHGEKMFGRDWRRKVAERGLLWDGAASKYVSHGEHLARTAPRGEAAPKAMPRGRVGGAGNIAMRWTRTSEAARSRVAIGWEAQLLERLEGAVSGTGEYAIYRSEANEGLRARVRASHEGHVNHIHVRFLS